MFNYNTIYKATRLKVLKAICLFFIWNVQEMKYIVLCFSESVNLNTLSICSISYNICKSMKAWHNIINIIIYVLSSFIFYANKMNFTSMCSALGYFIVWFWESWERVWTNKCNYICICWYNWVISILAYLIRNN